LAQQVFRRRYEQAIKVTRTLNAAQTRVRLSEQTDGCIGLESAPKLLLEVVDNAYCLKAPRSLRDLRRSTFAPKPSIGAGRLHVYPPAISVEFHVAIDERKNRIVPPQTDIPAGEEFCSTLAHNDVAGDDRLSAKFLYSKPFAKAVTPIFDAALTFLVSHRVN
jgi:hypothetical protein